MVLRECEFPSDHPDFTPEPQVNVHAQVLDRLNNETLLLR